MKFPFGQYVVKFFGIDELDLDLWVQIDSIEQPIKRNSGGPKNMSHCGTPSSNIILITASLSSNTYSKVLDAKVGRVRKHNQYYSKR